MLTRSEQGSRESWEQHRFVSWWSTSNEVRKQLKKPMDLVKFSWEKSTTVEDILTENKKIMEKYPKGKLKFIDG
jgi:hypothetical protein